MVEPPLIFILFHFFFEIVLIWHMGHAAVAYRFDVAAVKVLDGKWRKLPIAFIRCPHVPFVILLQIEVAIWQRGKVQVLKKIFNLKNYNSREDTTNWPHSLGEEMQFTLIYIFIQLLPGNGWLFINPKLYLHANNYIAYS
jgi:hypothetical protein